MEVIAERGIDRASVRLVIARAGVSSRTFYEQFEGLDDCLVEIMDRTLVEVSDLVSRAFDGQESWLDGMRMAVAAVLALWDAQPELAQVCLVETTKGSRTVLEQRQRVVRQFRATVVSRIEHQVSHPSPLAPEGVLASVMGIAHERIRDGAPGPLVEMLGPLMGLIAGQVGGQEMAAEQMRRGEALARAMMAAPRPSGPARPAERLQGDAPGTMALPATLGNPRARRARECLLFVAGRCRQGHHPSNREVADGIGVAHKSQISRLLHCLAETGLLANGSDGPGGRNSWRMTAHGDRLAHVLGGEAALWNSLSR